MEYRELSRILDYDIRNGNRFYFKGKIYSGMRYNKSSSIVNLIFDDHHSNPYFDDFKLSDIQCVKYIEAKNRHGKQRMMKEIVVY